MASQASGSTPGLVHGRALAIGTAPDDNSPAIIERDEPIGEGPNVQLKLVNPNEAGTAGISLQAGASDAGGIFMSGSAVSGIPASTFIMGNFSDAGNGIAFVADGEAPGFQISSANVVSATGPVGSSFHGDFGNATYGWSDSPGDGLILGGSGKPIMIAGGGFAMTWSQTSVESLVPVSPYSDGVQTLGSPVAKWGGLFLTATVTASGTTGARTINKPAGSVNFAAAAASLVVTNSLVTANSIILLTVGTNDSNCKSAHCAAASGSFTIYPDTPPLAETRVNFLIIQ